jgi:cell division protein FtsX
MTTRTRKASNNRMRTLAAWVQIAGIATVVLTLATLILVFLTYKQITHVREQFDTSRQIESVDLMLKFNERLNKEIQEFIRSVRQQEREASDYDGFEALAKEMSSITNKK